MSKSIRDVPKARKYTKVKRAPRRGELISVRLQRDQLDLLDSWRAKQKRPLTRPEALRQLMLLGVRPPVLRQIYLTPAKLTAEEKERLEGLSKRRH